MQIGDVMLQAAELAYARWQANPPKELPKGELVFKAPDESQLSKRAFKLMLSVRAVTDPALAEAEQHIVLSFIGAFSM